MSKADKKKSKKKIPRAKILKGKKPRANDVGVPEEEITLAQLIQNAAARGLHSARGGLYGRPVTDKELDGGDMRAGSTEDHSLIFLPVGTLKRAEDVPGQLRTPPKGATCACALGAQLLTPAVDNPVTMKTMAGNDAFDDERVHYQIEVPADERSANIGMAFEHALRP